MKTYSKGVASAILLVSLSGAVSLVHAGEGGGATTGNGGDGVVCRNPVTRAILSVELLDFYEAREMRGIEPDFGPTLGSYREQIQFALDRLALVAPKRAERYRTWAATFESEAKFLKGAKLVDIPDSQHLAMPDGCAVEQAVIQRAPQFPEDKRYTVNQDFWDRLSESSKAGLVLHEVIFREAISFKHRDSVHTRYLNSYIVSGKLNSMRPQQLLEYFQLVEFETADLYGFQVRIGWAPRGVPYRKDPNLLYHENGQVSEVVLLPGQVAHVGDIEIPLSTECHWGISKFNQQGKLSSFSTAGAINISLGERGQLQVGGVDNRSSRWCGEVSLDSSGKFERFWNVVHASLQVRGKSFELSAGGSDRSSGFELKLLGDGTFELPGYSHETYLKLRGGLVDIARYYEGQAAVVDWTRPIWESEFYGSESPSSRKFLIGGQEVWILRQVTFNPFDGGVRSARLAKDAVLKDAQGRLQRYRAHWLLKFDEQERVIAVEN